MWGEGIFGDFETPRKIDMSKMLGSEIKISEVQIGGNFSLIKDTKSNVYCWGSEYNKLVMLNATGAFK